MPRVFLLSILSCSLLLADNHGDMEALFNLSLEELMNVEVTTASQEKETLLETPAIVSVITAHQLKDWGVQNVYEALSFLPGIVINETYMGNTVVTFRGVTPGLFNNKALFMINSHPVYERLFGSAQVEYIPLEVIERIEVVRSPASVLYGTQAISGVVNIITKQGKENSNELSFRTGSNDHYYGSATIHDTHITMSASLQKDNGYNYGGTLAEDPLNDGPHFVNMDYQNDIHNLFLDVYGEQWRIQAGYFRQKDARYGFNPWVWLNGINDQESFYLDFYKAFTINSGTLEVNLRYDYADKQYDAGEFPFPGNGTSTLFNTVQRYSTEIKYKDHVGYDLSYIIGTTFEYDKSDPMSFIYDSDGSRNPFGGYENQENTENYALFAQLKYKMSQRWHAIAGFRVENNSDTGGSDLVPRLGITYQATQNTYIKALYAEAFRAPVFLEKYADVPNFLFGNQDLDREKIKTYELAIDSQLNQNNTLQVTTFWLELDNEITRRPTAGGGLEYYNAPGRNIYGIEASWLALLSTNLDLNLNGSYMNGEDKSVEAIQPGFNDDAPFIANYSMNAILSYHITHNWSATLSNQYVSSKDYILQDGSQGKISNYNLSNLVVNYKNHPFEGSLALKNIFDETYTYPEPIRRNLTEVPGGAGSTAYLTLRYYF